MSRAQITNDRYRFAFGVDHTPMGCFFQIWEYEAKGENPDADECEMPQVEADEMFGLSIYNPKTLERNPKLKGCLEPMSTLRNEETIIGIGIALGFDVSKKVYELWD